MKNQRLFYSVLVIFISFLLPIKTYSQNQDFENVLNAWDSLWFHSDINRYLFTNEYDECFFSIDQKAYMKEHKMLTKAWNKTVRKTRRKNYEGMREYFDERLYEAIEGATDDQLIKEASLYVNVLHPDSLENKALIYKDILLPLYSAKGDLNELHYISKLMEHYLSKEPSNGFISSVSAEALSVYEDAKSSAVFGIEHLKSMWVSKEFDKKSNLPMVMLSIREDEENNIYAILNRDSQYSRDYHIKNSTVSRIFYIDEDGDYHIQFCSMEFDDGLSETGVLMLSSAVNEASQGVVRAISRSNIGQVGSSVLGLGVSMLSAMTIAAIGDASANSLINSYLKVALRETEDRDIMLADFDLKQYLRESDNPSSIDSLSVRDTFELCKLLPEHGVFFSGKGLYPIVEPSRQAYVTPEYYRIYEGYDKYVRKYKTARSPAFWIFWYPLWPGMTVLYVMTGSTPNNKVQQKRFNQIYSER